MTQLRIDSRLPVQVNIVNDLAVPRENPVMLLQRQKASAGRDANATGPTTSEPGMGRAERRDTRRIRAAIVQQRPIVASRRHRPLARQAYWPHRLLLAMLEVERANLRPGKDAGSQNSLPRILTLPALAILSATTDRSRMKIVLPDATFFPFSSISFRSKGS